MKIKSLGLGLMFVSLLQAMYTPSMQELAQQALTSYESLHAQKSVLEKILSQNKLLDHDKLWDSAMLVSLDAHVLIKSLDDIDKQSSNLHLFAIKTKAQACTEITDAICEHMQNYSYEQSDAVRQENEHALNNLVEWYKSRLHNLFEYNEKFLDSLNKLNTAD